MKKYTFLFPIIIICITIVLLAAVFLQIGMGYNSWLKFLFYPAIAAGCFGISALVTKERYKKRKDTTGRLNTSITTGLIIFAATVAAFNMYYMYKFEQQMEYNSTRTKATVVGRDMRIDGKNKPKVNYDIYEFKYNNKKYRNEFRDKEKKLELGDTVIIIHSIDDPTICRLADYDSTFLGR